MSKQELITHKETLDFNLAQRQAKALFHSGLFSNISSEAQAIAKVLAGREYNLPPFASLTNIHIVQGKPLLSANAIATLIDSSDKYDYKIITRPEKYNERCDIKFFKDKEELGVSSFTIDEAKNAGLTNKDSWKKYPSDMLFARAISRGARRFAPSIFGGNPIYSEDEGEEFNSTGSLGSVYAKEERKDIEAMKEEEEMLVMDPLYDDHKS